MSAIQLNSPFLELKTTQQDHADNLTPDQADARALTGAVIITQKSL
jgi:hypothetical protein